MLDQNVANSVTAGLNRSKGSDYHVNQTVEIVIMHAIQSLLLHGYKPEEILSAAEEELELCREGM